LTKGKKKERKHGIFWKGRKEMYKMEVMEEEGSSVEGKEGRKRGILEEYGRGRGES